MSTSSTSQPRPIARHTAGRGSRVAGPVLHASSTIKVVTRELFDDDRAVDDAAAPLFTRAVCPAGLPSHWHEARRWYGIWSSRLDFQHLADAAAGRLDAEPSSPAPRVSAIVEGSRRLEREAAASTWRMLRARAREAAQAPSPVTIHLAALIAAANAPSLAA